MERLAQRAKEKALAAATTTSEKARAAASSTSAGLDALLDEFAVPDAPASSAQGAPAGASGASAGMAQGGDMWFGGMDGSGEVAVIDTAQVGAGMKKMATFARSAGSKAANKAKAASAEAVSKLEESGVDLSGTRNTLSQLNTTSRRAFDSVADSMNPAAARAEKPDGSSQPQPEPEPELPFGLGLASGPHTHTDSSKSWSAISAWDAPPDAPPPPPPPRRSKPQPKPAAEPEPVPEPVPEPQPQPATFDIWDMPQPAAEPAKAQPLDFFAPAPAAPPPPAPAPAPAPTPANGGGAAPPGDAAQNFVPKARAVLMVASGTDGGEAVKDGESESERHAAETAHTEAVMAQAQAEQVRSDFYA